MAISNVKSVAEDHDAEPTCYDGPNLLMARDAERETANGCQSQPDDRTAPDGSIHADGDPERAEDCDGDQGSVARHQR